MTRNKLVTNMALKDSDRYPYQVKLLELRADNPKNIRLFKKPSDMLRFHESTVPDEAQSLADFKKYGISERRIGINCSLDRSGLEVASSAPFKYLERDKRNPYPDFIGNQSVFKSLLAPNSKPVLYQAKKCPGNRSICLNLIQTPGKSQLIQKETAAVDNNLKEPEIKASKQPTKNDTSVISTEDKEAVAPDLEVIVISKDIEATNTSSDSSTEIKKDQTTGFVLERVLSTAFDTEGNNSLYGLFAAKLGKYENLDRITLAITSELDGLEYTEERASRLSKDDFRFIPEDLRSVVEVKSVNTSLFSPRTDKDKEQHYYEHSVLRKYWAHGRLTGLKNLLCGIVEGKRSSSKPRVKEVWHLNVQKIPEILQTATRSRDAWKRPFPESILSLKDRSRTAPNVGLEPWTEQKCFKEFHTALHNIKIKLVGVRPGNPVYFVYYKGKMFQVPEKQNTEVKRINSSVLFTVNHVRNQVIDTYQLRESVVTVLRGMAKGDGRFEFLKDWSIEDMKLNRRNNDKASKTIYLKLMFKSVHDAQKVLSSWTNPRRIKEHYIKASWATPTSTLRNFL